MQCESCPCGGGVCSRQGEVWSMEGESWPREGKDFPVRCRTDPCVRRMLGQSREEFVRCIAKIIQRIVKVEQGREQECPMQCAVWHFVAESFSILAGSYFFPAQSVS